MAAAALVVLALALAGCGDSAGKGSPDTVLRYFGRDAAFVAVVSTDLHDARYSELNGALGGRLLGGRPLAAYVAGLVGEAGVPYDRVIEPLLGNDLAVGSSGDGLAAALQVRDEENMRGLLDRSPLKPSGKVAGADTWTLPGGGTAVALDGDVVVAANSVTALAGALASRDSPGRLTARAFDAATAGQPRDDAIVRLYSDPRTLIRLRTLVLRRALALPWVRAMRGAGLTASIAGDRLRLDGAVSTDPASLSAADLPLPSGARTPMLPSVPGRAGSAAADPGRAGAFMWRALRTALPGSRFVRDVRALERDLHVDFERDLLRQFAGPSASLLDPATRAFAARSGVADPARLRALLPRVAPRLPRLVADLYGLRGTGHVRLVRAGSLYRMGPLRPPGPAQIWFGLRGRTFVVASDRAGARTIARTPVGPPPAGVHGAVVAAGDLSGLPPGATGLPLPPLGAVTAWADATTSRARGRATIELRP
jgi:hypothetical protein